MLQKRNQKLKQSLRKRKPLKLKKQNRNLKKRVKKKSSQTGKRVRHLAVHTIGGGKRAMMEIIKED